MRKYKTNPFGDEVDLDDPETYNYLPDDTNKLRQLMFAEIGMAYTYMDYWHPEVFEATCDQRLRVYKLIQNFAKNEKANYDNPQWYQEQIFLLQDETENMC